MTCRLTFWVLDLIVKNTTPPPRGGTKNKTEMAMGPGEIDFPTYRALSQRQVAGKDFIRSSRPLISPKIRLANKFGIVCGIRSTVGLNKCTWIRGCEGAHLAHVAAGRCGGLSKPPLSSKKITLTPNLLKRSAPRAPSWPPELKSTRFSSKGTCRGAMSSPG